MSSVSVHPSTPSAIRRHPTAWVGKLAGLMAVLAAWAIVLILHGSIPGVARATAAQFILEGQTTCMAGQGMGDLVAGCRSVGLPLGMPLITGMPQLLLASTFADLLGVGARTAWVLTGLTLSTVGLASAWGLFVRLGIQRWIAFGAGFAYQASVGLMGMAGFGGTFWGFVLLPLLILGFVEGAARVGRQKDPRSVVAGAVMLGATGLLAVFTDGYSFVVATVCAGLLHPTWPGRPASPRALLLGWFGMGVSLIVSVLAFRHYVPGGAEFGATSEGFFRGMGADVATLIWPASPVGWAAWTGAARNYSALYGDGTNSSTNYLGLTVLALAAVAIIHPRTRRKTYGLAGVALVTFILALGPSLKVMDSPGVKDEHGIPGYTMPAGEAVIDFPWGGLYPVVPGISEMRATYRWLLGTRLALAGLAAFGVAALIGTDRRGVRVLGVGLGVLAVVDVMANPVQIHSRQVRNLATVDQVRDEVAVPLRSAVRPGETLLLVPSDNDYLASYLVPDAGSRSFNVAGDKNNGLSRATWPDDVRQAALDPTPASIHHVLEGSADAVVVTYFSMRWNTYAFPPTEAQRQPGEQIAQQLEADGSFEVQQEDYFAVVRLAEPHAQEPSEGP